MKGHLVFLAFIVPLLGHSQSLSTSSRLDKNQDNIDKLNGVKSKTILSSNLLNNQYDPAEDQSLVNSQEQIKEEVPQDLSVDAQKKTNRFSSSFFLFVDGPGITQETHNYPTNALGRPDFTGINSFNVISFKYKLNDKYSLDLQTRTRVVFNNGVNSNNFKWFIWESPRIGVSGKLLSGQNWSVTGAVNTDFPYFLPEPFTGYTAREREVLFNPGMFANYNYSDPNSNWSYDFLLTPRFFLYQDDSAIEIEAINAGFSGANKPELVINMSPSVNYKIDEKLSWTAATTLSYIKQAGSSWDLTDATMISNTRESKWVFDGMPIMLGPNYKFSKSLSIFSFVQFFPIEKQRESYTTGRRAAFEDTVSFGMWIRGAVF